MDLSSARREKLRALVYVGTIAALALFYAVVSYASYQSFTWHNGGWYGELSRSFRQGQVALLSKPTPELLADPKPYRAGREYRYKWDVSFFHGKYYLYFGPTPVILFFLPWLLLTGQVLNQALAFWFICISEIVLFGLFLAAIVRLYRPSASIGVQALLLVLFGLGLVQAFAIHFVLVYEIATMTANTLILAMFYLIFLGLHSERRQLLFMALAATCWAAAVGSRATMISYGITFLPIFYHMIQGRPVLHAIKTAFVLALAPGVIGLLLAWYNFARFGSPLDFGLTYQLSSTNYQKLPRFSVGYFPMNLTDILLMPPRPSFDFPFLFAAPPQLSIFNPSPFSGPYIGVGWTVPVLAFGFAWPYVLRESSLRWFAGLLTFAAAAMLAMLSCYQSLYERYFDDFLLPLFVLLALVLIAGGDFIHQTDSRRRLFVAATVWTIYMGLALGIAGETNGIHNFHTWPAPAVGELWLPDGEVTQPHDQFKY